MVANGLVLLTLHSGLKGGLDLIPAAFVLYS